jgi:predicted alpha-1,2-mannosidase
MIRKIEGCHLWRGAPLLLVGMIGMQVMAEESLTRHVNPWMGVRGVGNTYPGPQLPWGSVNPGPDTEAGYTAGYNPKRKIRGFSQLHVSGTGGPGKYGQFLLSPQIGLKVGETEHDSAKTDEVATASRYQVRLTDYDILCEVTPTHHAALYRLTYPDAEEVHLVFDLGHNIPRDSNCFKAGYVNEGEVVVDEKTQSVQGWGLYWGGWSGEPFRVFFAARFNQPVAGFGTWKDGVIKAGAPAEREIGKPHRLGCFLKFKTQSSRPVLVKMAVSFTSVEQAERYLADELPDWDFEKVCAEADAAWNQKLEKVKVEGASDEQLGIFYSALHRTFIMPRNRTGDNPKWVSKVPYWDDQYCIWDTWKTLFPLHTLISESMVRDNLKAWMDRFIHNGEIADAFIAGNDRYYEWHVNTWEWLRNQGGDNFNNVFADAYLKGVEGIDWKAAYAILKFSADAERAPAYRAGDRGWLPYRCYPFGLVCSRSMEFAYNDFCVAQMASRMGEKADAERYLMRSRQWTNLWNAELESDGFKGFIAPRDMNGKWFEYDPKTDKAASSPGGLDRAFYEGSSWVYSFFAPHDFSRLIQRSGGAETYVKKLQHAMESGEHHIFVVNDGTVGIGSAPGLIDMSNEPSFMTPFSFIYAGRPDLTSYWVRKNMANYTRDNFPGDEDSGAMSAWYVFAALGLFPNAGQDLYLLSGPLFPRATLQRENKSKIVIEGVNVSPDNIYVQSVTLNGQSLERAWIRHQEIKDGATLRFVMGDKPSAWGKKILPPALLQCP